MILYLFPTFSEASIALKLIYKKFQVKKLNSKLFYFEKNKQPCLLAIVGMGKLAHDSLLNILSQKQIKEIYLYGFAGALKKTYKGGDALLIDEPYLLSNQNLLNPFFIKKEAITFCSDQILNAESKNMFFKNNDADVVEMESSYVQEIAKKNKIIFHHIRWIFDEQDEEIIDAKSWIDEYGQVKALALVQHLLKHPRLIYDLILFFKKYKKVQKKMKEYFEVYFGNSQLLV